MEEFIKEVKEMSTADIMLILEDQLDLYNEEEIKILKDELFSRPANSLEMEEKEREKIEEKKREIERQKRNIEIERINRERLQQEYNHKIDNLNRMGLDGYYEYKVVSLNDNNAGGIYSSTIENTLNELGLDGWKLRCAYTNELGKNSSSGGFAGFSKGTNSTIDQNILIFERFVRINRE